MTTPAQIPIPDVPVAVSEPMTMAPGAGPDSALAAGPMGTAPDFRGDAGSPMGTMPQTVSHAEMAAFASGFNYNQGSRKP